MEVKGVPKNEWKVQPDTTVQVVDPRGIDELSDEGPRNWYGICVSLVIIFIVGVLVTVATILVIPLQVPPFYGRRLTLADLQDPRFSAARFGSQWLSDYELAYMSEENGLLVLNIGDNSTTRLISNLTLHQIEVQEFSISANRQYVLLLHDIKEGRLFKREAKYSIYDVRSNRYYPLKLNSDRLEHPRYQHAQWVKDAQKILQPVLTKENFTKNGNSGSELIVIDENDIYYLSEPHGTVYRLTHDGRENEIYNGVPDLMYEEILRSSSSVWPSPSGQFLAYVSFNDSQVKELPVLKYQNEDVPLVVPLRYATVISALPETTVWIVDCRKSLTNSSRWRLTPPVPISRAEHYVLGVGWVDDTKLWVSWLSRDQRTSLLATCEGDHWQCSMVHVNHRRGGTSPTVQSVAWTDSWVAFPWPIHTINGWWYNHIAVVGVEGGRLPSLTLNECHVDEVLASHPSEIKIYFLGSKISEGTEKQHLFVVSWEEDSLRCITCSIGCARVVVDINTGLTHAVATCIGSYLPAVYLVDIARNHSFTLLHEQARLRDSLADIALPVSIYRDINLSSEFYASVYMAIPPGWSQDDSSFLYPFVIHILGVENFDEVDVELRLGLDEFLASAHQIAHARLKLWGNDLSKHVSTRTIALTIGNMIKALLDEYEFLDRSQLSVWGWGSGASLALEMLGNYDKMLNCVLAINPVMDWKKYGSYWAERFLGPLISEGAGRRFEESNLLNRVMSFGSSKVMLMQSTADPLSHHSYSIAKALIDNKIYFQHVVYPDSSASLRHERAHVLKTMEEFFVRQECMRSFYDDG